MVKHASNHPSSSNDRGSSNAASSLFFSGTTTNPSARHGEDEAAAGMNIDNGHGSEEDPDFIDLVSQLKKTKNVSKMPLKKQWKRKKAHWSSEKINEWWARALDCAKETHSSSAVQTENQSSSSSRQDNGQRQRQQQQQQQEMVQALSDAVAQLDQDKKKDPDVLREIGREKRAMFRKQHSKASISNADFKILWRSVWVKVADIHGIAILKRRNSLEQEQQLQLHLQQQQQQGTRKPPPEVANAVAAAAAKVAAAAATGTDRNDDDDDKDKDALAGPPIKKRKKIMVEQQQQQQQQQQQSRQQSRHQRHLGLEIEEPITTGNRNKRATSTNTLPPRTVAASNNAHVSSSSSNVVRTRVESSRDKNIYYNRQAETIVIDDDSDDEDAAQQQLQHQHQQQPEPMSAEELRFQKMVQEIEDESASERHVPLQVILQTQRQPWENHLVHEGPLPARLSDLEFASLWKRVEQRACENWHRRIQSSLAPADWSFLVFGKHYDAKKATTYFHGWDTMARANTP